jgi:hypothetical protein
MARPSGQPKRARFEVSVVPRLVPEDLEAELQADEAEEAEEAEVAEDAVEEEDEDLDKDEDEDDSKGITLDPNTVAHEHHSFFFPDNGHGAANAAGFGWRNGG